MALPKGGEMPRDLAGAESVMLGEGELGTGSKRRCSAKIID